MSPVKTKKASLFLAALLALTALACRLVDQAMVSIDQDIVRGSGNVVSEERPVSGFTRVELSGVGDVEVTFGEPVSLTITAEDNLLPLITTEVSGNTLKIGLVEGKTPVTTHPIQFDLTVPALEVVSIPGLGNVHLPAVTAGDFQADIPGAGNLIIDSLQADSLEAQLPGLGSLEIGGGEVQEARVHISGAGDFTAPDLQIAVAEVSISGLGSATLRVSDSLKADISGGGSVEYYGSPAVEENVSGLGSVKKLED